MGDIVNGKLELLFAHLSINNVHHIQPLLIEAMDEYQNIRRSLSYEEKRNLNFVKTLLWHADRGEWAQARHRLHDAQKAYQEYVGKQMTIMKKPLGYSQIHGKTPYVPYSTADMKLHEYMQHSQHIDNSIKSLKGTKPLLAIKDTEQKVTPPSGPGKQDENVRKGYSSTGTDEQGPTVSSRPWAFSDTTLHPNQCSDLQQYSRHPVERLSQSCEDIKAIKDSFRPTKVGDAYWALYKKEWIRALEAIKLTGIKECTAISCLYYMLQEAYQFCLLEAKSQVVEFENAALNILTDGRYSQEEKNKLQATGNLKHMIKYRNEVASVAVSRLQEMYLTKILPPIHRKYSVRTQRAIDDYARMCVNVTWPMAVQDPPFQIVYEKQKPDDDDFEPSLYDPYKCGGNKVDYFVWPALRLYENGPILCRGVAQGKSNSNRW